MKLLLTNDDGIDAPGLAALAAAAEQLGEAVVVAPLEGHSGCGHRVTTDEELTILGRGVSRFAVDGTPADCVRVALHSLAPEASHVLAGINAGGNLGADVWISGTVAAVREAVWLLAPGNRARSGTSTCRISNPAPPCRTSSFARSTPTRCRSAIAARATAFATTATTTNAAATPAATSRSASAARSPSA
jgi:hypothetical protein